MKKERKFDWKFILIGVLLAASIMFFHMSREQEGLLFLMIGAVLFVIALLILKWIDKKSKNKRQ